MVYGYLNYQSTLNGGLKITSFVLFEHFFQVGSKKPPSINVSHFYALIAWILLFLVSGGFRPMGEKSLKNSLLAGWRWYW